MTCQQPKPMPLRPEAVTLLRMLARCPKDGMKIRFSAKRYGIADALRNNVTSAGQWPLYSPVPLVRIEHSPRTGYVTAYITDGGRAELEAL